MLLLPAISVETDQNLAVTVELNASDVDGDTLTYSIVTQPKHGLLEKKSVNQWTYQPFEQFTGTDSFGYRASDSMVEGNLAVVSVVVNKVNNPPMIQASTFSVEEDGSLPIKLVASDPDGDELTFIVTKDPANGKLVGKGPSYLYAPMEIFMEKILLKLRLAMENWKVTQQPLRSKSKARMTLRTS